MDASTITIFELSRGMNLNNQVLATGVISEQDADFLSQFNYNLVEYLAEEICKAYASNTAAAKEFCKQLENTTKKSSHGGIVSLNDKIKSDRESLHYAMCLLLENNNFVLNLTGRHVFGGSWIEKNVCQ